MLRSPFKWIYVILSHGLFHIILLIIVFCFACYFFFDNKDKLNKTVAHTINVKIDTKDRIPDELGNRFHVDLKSLNVSLSLNSDSVSKETKGKYRDAITIRYLVPDREIEGEKFLPLCGDTVNVSILRQPFEGDIEAQSVDYKAESDSPLVLSEIYYPTEILKDSDGICTIRTTLTNMVKIPYGEDNWIQGHKLIIYCNDFGVGKSPYYYYNIKFELPDTAKLNSVDNGQFALGIDLDDSWTYDEQFGFYSNKQILIHKIEPKPDYVNGFKIAYNSKEKLKEIVQNQGVFLYAEDLEASNKDRQKEFLNSVLFGTCLAFMIDIIIQLVLKLRRLHKNRNKE